ncbi:glycosyltransferase family 2 protein [Flavobacteriaceae bacterium]|jgi:glycosyltransferase involved in cell wall biosynthesis|nr:glycosyltransferase family 2 protein [Flavobacteriaceae bacterium]MDA7566923.1 glycosyltransferase family 2 protein [Flavobacteriaceae bacterium]MDA8558290.1 glycosyltransferase family 2 protein [Flavobacteriaceae bacterium]MDA8640854.1 glycosyltransferase family 2 protein [Flavobacteriaceae bacterium]MDB0023078.1 glycosyltransferase family 2 protein [Flavobacteriaceae bacterium]|tara:strand:+ start:4245 stop:5192 length:948 start_codon:yes stop_codon:yes gene_type:complete
MDISIVIPLLNEQNSLEELSSSVSSVINDLNLKYEIILIDDGSTDNSWKIISKICLKNQHIKGIRFLKNFGKSQALSAGFKACNGDVVITMDADLQDDPNEIPELYKKINEDNFDLVSGWKKVRYDSIIFKNFPSKIFNWAARITSGLKLNDFNCGIKAYKKEVIQKVKLTGGMHRYIPVLAKNAGYNRITEKIVIHHPRKHGKTKYGIDRFIKGFLDLITLWFIHKFGKRPMHFFGLIGTIMLLVGFFFSAYLGIDKLFLQTSGRLITERPEFYISLATMIMGSQFFLAGFLGEIILRNRKIKKQYIITEKINE